MPRLHVPCEQIRSKVIFRERFWLVNFALLIFVSISCCWPLSALYSFIFFPLSDFHWWEGIHFSFGCFEDLLEFTLIELFPGSCIFLYMILEKNTGKRQAFHCRNSPGHWPIIFFATYTIAAAVSNKLWEWHTIFFWTLVLPCLYITFGTLIWTLCRTLRKTVLTWCTIVRKSGIHSFVQSAVQFSPTLPSSVLSVPSKLFWDNYFFYNIYIY